MQRHALADVGIEFGRDRIIVHREGNFSASVPGSVTNAISPSQVLHSQPLRENFCTKPARSPSEYDQCSVSQVNPANPAITTISTASSIFMGALA